MTSLKQYDLIADRIRLHRQVSVRPVLVVEGPTDEQFCERVLPVAMDTFVATTRGNVLAVAQKLSQFNLTAVLCVVDRDFDDVVTQATDQGWPVVAYDGADLEGMLLFTNALSVMLSALASGDKLRRYGGVAAIRERVVSAVLPISCLRRANAVGGWGLVFDAVELRNRIDGKSLALKAQSYCDALYAASDSGALGVSRADVYGVFTNSEVDLPVSGVPLVRGRDALSVLGEALRRHIGSLSRDQADADHLASILRLTATTSDVKATEWFASLKQVLQLPENT